MIRRTVQPGLLLLMAALLATAGCVPHMPGAPQTPPVQPPLADSSWVLEALGQPGSLRPALETTEVTLTFSGQSEATGNAGCNSFGGSYTSDLSGGLQFAELVHTEMYCIEPGVMEQEKAFLDALAAAEQYEFVDGRLQVSGGGMVLVLSQS